MALKKYSGKNGRKRFAVIGAMLFTGILSVSPVSAFGADKPPDCILKIEFNKPVADNARTFQKAISKELFYSASRDYFYLKLPAAELNDKLGLELVTRIIPRAGNSGTTNVCFYEIKDMKSLKKKLQSMVRGIRVENDPKFDLYDNAEPFNASARKNAMGKSSEANHRMIEEGKQRPGCGRVVALKNDKGEIGGYYLQPSIIDSPIHYYDQNGNYLTTFHIFAPDSEKTAASAIIQRLRAEFPLEQLLQEKP